MINILIGKDATLGDSEVHEAVLRMEDLVGPMTDLEIMAYLSQRIFLAVYQLLQVDELRHPVYLGMNLINIIPFVHN